MQARRGASAAQRDEDGRRVARGAPAKKGKASAPASARATKQGGDEPKVRAEGRARAKNVRSGGARNGEGAGAKAAARERDRARSELEGLRERLDALDADLLEVLAQRYAIIAEVQRIKRASGDGPYVPERERAQIDRLLELNRKAGATVPESAIEAIFREVLSASRALQGPITVAYFGPAGTYSERAAREHFGSSAEFAASASIAEVFRVVESGQARFGVVPIENSTEGMVGHTMDCLAGTSLRIVGERELLIRHNLMGRARSLAQVRQIVSHPQSLAQCREWLARNAGSVPTAEAASNAAAAALAARRAGTAAIAGSEAARRYGLNLIAENIQDVPRNITRFVVIAATDGAGTGADKMSVLFSVKNEPGMLFRSLEPLAKNGVDLCKIESRPMRGQVWSYLFFLDFRGSPNDPRVRRALAAMERHCVWLKVLGAYPAARAA